MFSSAATRTKIHSLMQHLRSYPFLQQKENAERCAMLLETIDEQHAIYSQLCYSQKYFLQHFQDILSKQNIDEDDIFPLLEDLLILVREKTLRAGFTQANDAERAALTHVLDGEHWDKEDGTLFSETFFYKVPLSLIHAISNDLHCTEQKSIYPTQ
ncbi:hypothetical protein [Halodesulfovibrio spirochaetisodalis]|uniref:Uncharacterized protein n=1 Tax=Halodesulfovibrio spirochaetisodalis TaxID=1560234 RepID=A0A1B7XER6_9BACT|nr:hypothetical protein [Halodesulfovibrio spirochaetisodalis]OBQ52674.1 hypothetical protein SP90_06800 [Halodesulfovibrio spirochaetisodalis]